MHSIRNEVELAALIIAWLQDQHWDVYQEVAPKYGSKRADIVAVQGRIVWVIETKMKLGLEVLEQAYMWSEIAHLVSVGVPDRKATSQQSRPTRRIVWNMLDHFGIGLLRVDPDGAITTSVAGRIHRTAMVDYLRDALCEEHKTFAQAGNDRSEFWSPFKETCRKVHDHVTKYPGTSIRHVLDNINTHYAHKLSAATSLMKWIIAGKVPGVRAERTGKQIKLFAS